MNILPMLMTRLVDVPDLVVEAIGPSSKVGLAPSIAAVVGTAIRASIPSTTDTIIQHATKNGSAEALTIFFKALPTLKIRDLDPSMVAAMVESAGLTVGAPLVKSVLGYIQGIPGNSEMTVGEFIASGSWVQVRNKALGLPSGDARWCPHCNHPMFSMSAFPNSKAVVTCPTCKEHIFLE